MYQKRQEINLKYHMSPWTYNDCQFQNNDHCSPRHQSHHNFCDIFSIPPQSTLIVSISEYNIIFHMYTVLASQRINSFTPEQDVVLRIYCFQLSRRLHNSKESVIEISRFQDMASLGFIAPPKLRSPLIPKLHVPP